MQHCCQAVRRAWGSNPAATSVEDLYVLAVTAASSQRNRDALGNPEPFPAPLENTLVMMCEVEAGKRARAGLHG
ncbi:MAG: hypothetical protein GC129_06095 [Proteobacteria bacterium]|nr:hypothetical protein [Pseudomonadota bacterium]